MTNKLTSISGSSITDFQNCPLRFCYRWLENRIPRHTPAALTVGTAVHQAFEGYFTHGELSLGDYLADIVDRYKDAVLTDREEKALATLENLVEPLSFWTDAFPIDETLEVEEPFSFPVQWLKDEWGAGRGEIMFQGTPDRVVRIGQTIFHCQHKTLADTANVGIFIETAKRTFHELIYGWYLERKYCDFSTPTRSVSHHVVEWVERGTITHNLGWTYGGTLYNIIRKLQYKSKAKATPGKILHEPHEFFLQTPIPILPHLQQQALDELPILAARMVQTAEDYFAGRVVPSNRSLDRGLYGHGDPYFRVITGEISLSDDLYFMDREDTRYDSLTPTED